MTTELDEVVFGDLRLERRAKSTLKKLFDKVGSGLSSLGGSAELKAVFRLFSNSRVTPSLVLAPHRKNTIERIKQFPLVCLVQDTTDLDYKHMTAVENLGVLNDTKRPGCSFHPLVAFTPQKLCLGIVSAKFIQRPPEELGKKKHNNLRPIETKESYRWLEAYQEGCRVADEAPDTSIVVIGDRESDIYELLLSASKPENKAHLLVRAWHDRKTFITEDAGSLCISSFLKTLATAPMVGTCEFDIPKRIDRPARHIKQTVRSKQVTFVASSHKKELPNVTINAVLMEETDPPVGEEPVKWMFLTTLPVTTDDDIKTIIELYLSRWGIEMFFKTLKSGCKIEKLQFKEAEHLLVCIAFYLIVAWRVMYATFLGRSSPNLSCSVMFEPEEWQAVCAVVTKSAPPPTAPLLGEFIRMVAGLGGYRGAKGDGPPGIKAMWQGLQQAHALGQGWAACKRFG
jgi:hypothetical protein